MPTLASALGGEEEEKGQGGEEGEAAAAVAFCASNARTDPKMGVIKYHKHPAYHMLADTLL